MSTININGFDFLYGVFQGLVMFFRAFSIPFLSVLAFIVIFAIIRLRIIAFLKKKGYLDVLEVIKPKKNTIENKPYFDEVKSILYLRGFKIPIAIQDKITNAHKILNYIFITNKDNLGDDFYYAEIAEKEFNEPDYKNKWRMFHTACQDIQDKIRISTHNAIEDFLDFNSSKRGRVKINPKYLPKQAEKPQEFLGKS